MAKGVQHEPVVVRSMSTRQKRQIRHLLIRKCTSAFQRFHAILQDCDNPQRLFKRTKAGMGCLARSFRAE